MCRWPNLKSQIDFIEILGIMPLLVKMIKLSAAGVLPLYYVTLE